MVNNILIEVLGAIAQQERLKTRVRQQEGINTMMVIDGKKVSAKTGKAYGRSSSKVDKEVFEKILQKTKKGKLTVKEACKD